MTESGGLGKVETATQQEFVDNFARHREESTAEFLKKHDFFKGFAEVLKRIVEESLKRRGILVHSVQARAKDPGSFGKKAVQPSNADPSKLKYANPMKEITDLAAARVITYFPDTQDEVHQMLSEEFEVVEHSDKGEKLIAEERFGYQSIHYLVRLKDDRIKLPEYESFTGSVAEIQVRTILQHAWAEIEHDIQYKSAVVIPTEIRRRFMALAGMLEIADREFQSIQNADKELRARARVDIAHGHLSAVEITPDAVKTFLNTKLGADGRISEYSYGWTAQLLRSLRFATLAQVEECIRSYDDDELSRIISGSRQGQTTRFENMLLAGMGRRFIERHPWADEDWKVQSLEAALAKLESANIRIGDYDSSVQCDAAESDEGRIE